MNFYDYLLICIVCAAIIAFIVLALFTQSQKLKQIKSKISSLWIRMTWKWCLQHEKKSIRFKILIAILSPLLILRLLLIWLILLLFNPSKIWDNIFFKSWMPSRWNRIWDLANKHRKEFIALVVISEVGLIYLIRFKITCFVHAHSWITTIMTIIFGAIPAYFLWAWRNHDKQTELEYGEREKIIELFKMAADGEALHALRAVAIYSFKIYLNGEKGIFFKEQSINFLRELLADVSWSILDSNTVKMDMARHRTEVPYFKAANEIIAEGLFNRWFEDYIFQNWNFAGFTFSYATCKKIKFINCNFISANFITYCDFSNGCFMDNCDFLWATFKDHCNFNGVTIVKNCHFQCATFSDDCNFRSVLFLDCDFRGTNFLGNCDFSDAKFYNPRFDLKTSFEGCIYNTQTIERNGKTLEPTIFNFDVVENGKKKNDLVRRDEFLKCWKNSRILTE